MTNGWNKVFEINIENRNVTGSIHIEGGYQITTTQKNDYSGSIIQEDSSTIINTPVGANSKIEFDEENLTDIYNGLINIDFTEESAKIICDKFKSEVND